MKKNTVIRNNSPHAVKMGEGSNVAESKVKKITGVQEEEPKTKSKAKVKAQPVAEPAPEVKPVPAKAPQRATKKALPKVRLKTPPPPAPPAAPAAVTPVQPRPMTAQPPAALTPTPILDEASLWEQDDPVKSRLAQLRTRNALLDEQLQKLKNPFHAQGKKS